MTEWSYTGATGPDRWGTLNPDWALADVGYRQSPVDLGQAVVGDVPGVTFMYGPASASMVIGPFGNKIIPTGVQAIETDGDRLEVIEIHAHTPAEHPIDGRLAPAEVHIVHRDAYEQLMVVGVFVEPGGSNPVVNALAASESVSDMTIDPAELLPDDVARAFSYSGSLTTPPCTEGVQWHVLAEPTQATDAEIAALVGRQGRTNRPAQDLHGRRLTRS